MQSFLCWVLLQVRLWKSSSYAFGEPIIPGVMCRHWGVFTSGKHDDFRVSGSRSDSWKSWSSLWHKDGICASRETEDKRLARRLVERHNCSWKLCKKADCGRRTSQRLFCMYAELKASSTSSLGRVSRNCRTCCFRFKVPARADITGCSVTTQDHSL